MVLNLHGFKYPSNHASCFHMRDGNSRGMDIFLMYSEYIRCQHSRARKWMVLPELVTFISYTRISASGVDDIYHVLVELLFMVLSS